jgi:hypothetical protein
MSWRLDSVGAAGTTHRMPRRSKAPATEGSKDERLETRSNPNVGLAVKLIRARYRRGALYGSCSHCQLFNAFGGITLDTLKSGELGRP